MQTDVFDFYSELDRNKLLESAMDHLEIIRVFEIFCLFDTLTSAALTKKFDVIIVDSLHNILSPLAENVRIQTQSMHIMEAWVADLCLLMKSLSAQGTTVIFTTTPQAITRQGKDVSQADFRHLLMDVLDVHIRLKSGTDLNGIYFHAG